MTDITIRTKCSTNIDNVDGKRDIPCIYNGLPIGKVLSSNPDEGTITVRIYEGHEDMIKELIGPQPRLMKIIGGE